jgi:HEAT repeat protein
VPILVKAIADPRFQIRQAAIQTLGNMGTDAKAAEPALQALAKNDQLPTIRELAKNALKAVRGEGKMPTPARSGARM